MTKKSTTSSGHALPDLAAIEAHATKSSAHDRDHALAKAQKLMYEAWGRTTSRARENVAFKALGFSPLCADAYSLLASHAPSTQKAAELYGLGVRAGELALGPEGFREYDGEFWGFLETRPYMRARHGLALSLLELGNEDAAIAHFRAMLDLNAGDNQGIRYLLLARLVERDDTKAVKALLASYANEESVQWLYTKALLAYREGRAASKTTLALLKDAFEENPYVPKILAQATPPIAAKKSFVMVGGADEAKSYVLEFGSAWKKTGGAVEWLVTSKKGAAAH